MLIETIVLAVIFILQSVLIVIMHEKITKVEQMLSDVSLDINVYEQLKLQESKTVIRKPINKVGTWKK